MHGTGSMETDDTGVTSKIGHGGSGSGSPRFGGFHFLESFADVFCSLPGF